MTTKTQLTTEVFTEAVWSSRESPRNMSADTIACTTIQLKLLTQKSTTMVKLRSSKHRQFISSLMVSNKVEASSDCSIKCDFISFRSRTFISGEPRTQHDNGEAIRAVHHSLQANIAESQSRIDPRVRRGNRKIF